MKTGPESPLQFPCSFPLKVMGENTEAFHAVVEAILVKHLTAEEEILFSSRTSAGDKYRSITATFTARSRKQLDDIYRELHAHPKVLMTL